MKKIKFILFLLISIFSFEGYGQVNLVPNYSFESYTTCPTASGQISYAVPWIGTNSSTDYFSSCAPSCFCILKGNPVLTWNT